VAKSKDRTPQTPNRDARKHKFVGYMQHESPKERLPILGPLVLPADLLLLLGCEVVCDVESLTDLLRGLALDHVGDGLATDIKQSLDVKIIGGLASKLVGYAKSDEGGGTRTKMISNSIS